MLDSFPYLEKISFPPLQRDKLKSLQINLGYLCNLQCQHCHVNAGPLRKEIMDEKTWLHILDFIQEYQIKQVDLTGGAPEMHPFFAQILKQLHSLGCHIIVRTNLVILKQSPYQSLMSLMKQYGVELMASMPCYLEENVDKQRGDGTFNDSIEVLQQLNQLGYGQLETNLILNLVYNPQDAHLPPEQAELEHDYKNYLLEHYQIRFNQLLTITNIPIKRFGSMLLSKGKFDDYMNLLQASYQAKNLEAVMCLSLLSVDWLGYVYDCDFNQMLSLPIEKNEQKIHISDYHPQIDQQLAIKVSGHCYACVAGNGSSCGGSLT